jgi:hypothetical protein
MYLDWQNSHLLDIDVGNIGLILWSTRVTKVISSKVSHKTLCIILIYLALLIFYAEHESDISFPF